MDSLDPASSAALAPVIPVQRPPRIWKFWGTALWGLVVFGAMFAGQMAVVPGSCCGRKGRSIWPPRSVC